LKLGKGWPILFMHSGGMVNKLLKNSRGFSMFEILIAFTLFAIFTLAYNASMGRNKEVSFRLREELALQKLCEEVLNELVLNPPKFDAALLIKPDTRTFEDFKQYKAVVTYKRLDIPSFDLLIKADENDSDPNSQEQQNKAATKKVYSIMEDYIEDAIWQVEVKVMNIETKYSYSLSTWLSNNEAEPKVQI